jgi:hypothetical protein
MTARGSLEGILWWIRQTVLILLACFFLIFGVHLLISGYQLRNPYAFILTFFASNLIILISAALLITFAFQMKRFYKGSRNKKS